MTTEAQQLMAAAIEKYDLKSGFCPITLGAKIGLNKIQSELAARALSDAGVLVLGFDLDAHFSLDFRKSKMGRQESSTKKKAKKITRRKAEAEPALV